MSKIKNTNVYLIEKDISMDDILLGSKQDKSGKTSNFKIKDLSNTIGASLNLGDFNGTVGVTDNPDGKTKGYWIANELGVYPNFGGVNNVWDTGIIYFDIDGNFQIKEFVQLDVQDTLDSTETTKPLSANMGRELDEKIDTTKTDILNDVKLEYNNDFDI